MTRLKRDYHRDKLHTLLSQANDADFLVFVWAVYSLQNGNSAVAAGLIDAPVGADQKGFDAPYRIFPWHLETIANELLVTPKVPPPLPGQRFRRLNPRLFDSMAKCANALRGWEDGEHSLHLNSENVLHEMTRVGHQQFDWQRGYDNAASFYRTAHIYGGAETKAYFLESVGCTLEDFMLVGFALYATSTNQPLINAAQDFQVLGISPALLKAALRRLAISLQDARTKALEMRAGGGNPAYKPSLLRPYPTIYAGTNSRVLLTPLPPLLIQRITDGIYYDVISGPDIIKTEIGNRFEAYSLTLLQSYLTSYVATGEIKYRRRGKDEVASPDILVTKDGSVRLAVECKAKRMPFNSRFGDDPTGPGDKGFEELAKGVLQVWRFFCDARLGRVPGVEIDEDALCVVLTLDPWPQMSTGFGDRLIAHARLLASTACPELVDADCRPVTVVWMSDLEPALANTTDEGIFQAIRESASKERSGWMLSNLSQTLDSKFKRPVRLDYPFKGDLPTLLPWWKIMGSS